ncbi:MAG: glycosyltransferase family 2 protein [Bacteroidetes bacterium]|nr:MAG: glycosyltransferase family 2 protein [Bacteroidota bacterium]
MIDHQQTQEKYPLVSIITINYNHADITCQMLESLSLITYPHYEVIVIDNGSPDDDPKIIHEKFPQVTYLETGENLGFAGANNLGICMSKGKYILLINNDTVVTPGFLKPLVDKMESDPEIGAVSPKIRYYFLPDTLQYAGMTPINSFTVRSHSYGYMEKDTGQHDQDRISAYAHGAAMMVSRKVVEQVGLMSLVFFLYYEELDWGFRIRQAGYKIFYVHNSLIYHLESVATGKQSPLKTYYLNRSRLLYMRRNVRGPKSIIPILFQLLVAIPKNMIHFLLQGRVDLFRAYCRAVGWQIRTVFQKFIHQHPTC